LLKQQFEFSVRAPVLRKSTQEYYVGSSALKWWKAQQNFTSLLLVIDQIVSLSAVETRTFIVLQHLWF